MKINRVLKIISIVFECSFFGSLILYLYNYFTLKNKYTTIPSESSTVLNIFLIIAIISFILFFIIKYVLYLRNKTTDENVQLEMELDKNEGLTSKTLKDLEAPVTERVFIYKDEYTVPLERRMHCPNCDGIIDKNAYICVRCGYLIKSIVEEKIVERVIERPVEKIIEKPVERIIEKPVNTYNNKYYDSANYGYKDKIDPYEENNSYYYYDDYNYNSKSYKRPNNYKKTNSRKHNDIFLTNLGLVLSIIACISFIIAIAMKNV